MHASRTVIAAAAIAAAAVLSQGACTREAGNLGALPPDEAAALLDKRIWLDREPRSPRDEFHVLAFNRRSSTGVFQHGTVWKGQYEIFLYEAQKGRIDMKLPGSHKRVQTGFTVERVRRGDADVKLTLDRAPVGPTVYYGYNFEGHDADAWLAARFTHLRD